MSTTIRNHTTTRIRSARAIVTNDRRFRFTLPLPEQLHAAIVEPTGRTIATIRRSMQALLNAGYGVRCPLTGEVLRLYRRPLTTNHVTLLERLYRKSRRRGRDFLHIHDFTVRSDGDLAKLRFWGLIEPRLPTEQDDGRGFWRMTDLGKRWLFEGQKIPRHVAVFRGEPLGFWDERDLIGPRDVEPEFTTDLLFGGRRPVKAA